MTHEQRLFAISGCSGGGKSTLIEALAQRGHAVVREAGRMLVREQDRIDGPGRPGSELFGHLLLSRSMYLYDTAVADHPSEVIFFDRSILEPVTGWLEAGIDEPWLHNAAAQYRYAKTVVMAPPWREIFVTDRERKHDFEAGVREFDALMRRLPELGYEPVLLPRASVAERVAFVEAIVRDET